MIIPKVSIIIPVYNVEKYLNKCLDSALNQTIDNFEVIAIDDGSIDNSLNILYQYKERYNNLIVISQANKGVSKARNVGILRASGKYIYFLDSDDYIDLDTLEICFSECENNNLDILYFDAEVKIDSESNIKKDKFKFNYSRGENLDSNIYKGIDFYKILINKGCFKASPCLQFLRKKYIMKNNIFFYEGIIHEDELFTTNALIKANKVKYINKNMFYRVVRSNSIMTVNKSIKNVEGYCTVVKKLLDLYKEFEIYELKKHIEEFYNGIINLCDNLILNNTNKRDATVIKNKLCREIRMRRKEIISSKLKLKAYFPRLILIKKYIQNIKINRFKPGF